MAFPVAALLQAGGQVISSIFNKPDKPKVISPAEQIASTVKGAREAGIHPLAALGAQPGYTTVSGGPSNPVGSAVGEGMKSLGQSMAQELPAAQVANLAADTDARKAQAELYRAQSRTMIANAQRAAIGGPKLNADTPKPITSFGITGTRDPKKFSSAQDVSDEYGDIVESLHGAASLGSTVLDKVAGPGKPLSDAVLLRQLRRLLLDPPRAMRGQKWMR